MTGPLSRTVRENCSSPTKITETLPLCYDYKDSTDTGVKVVYKEVNSEFRIGYSNHIFSLFTSQGHASLVARPVMAWLSGRL